MIIAILEKDADIATEMKFWLEEAGNNVQIFDSNKGLLAHIGKESFDAIVVDWALLGIPASEVLRWLRVENGSMVPMLFLATRNTENDVVNALSARADDFMVKPVRRGELLARINTLVRRETYAGRETFDDSFPPFRIVTASRQIYLHDEPISLTEKEFDLAIFLFQNSGKLLSRDYISESVWARHAKEQSRTIDTHVSRVRKKLCLEPVNGYRLVPVYNIGYRLERVVTGANLSPHWAGKEMKSKEPLVVATI